MPPPPYTMESFKDAAASFFRATTGQSPRVAAYYLTLPRSFLNQPITPENISKFVAGENRAVLFGTTPMTAQDRLAIAAIPGREVAAHFVAQNVVAGSQGYFADNEYSHEALSALTSGTF